MRVIRFVLARSITLVSFAADAQQGKPYRVGVLVQGSPPPPGTQHYSSQPCATSGMSMDRTLSWIVGGQAVRANVFPFLPVSLLLYTSAGGLMSCGPSAMYRWKMAAVYVDKILRAPSRTICRCSSRHNSNSSLTSRPRRLSLVHVKRLFSDAGAIAAASSSPGGIARHTGPGVPT